jgi:succinoglycan biosynthesis transport protein ExoP
MNIELYLYNARRWALWAVLPALLVAVAGYFYTRHEAKTYQTSTTLYVQEPNSGGGVPGSTDIFTSEALIPTYSEMINSPVIATHVDTALATKYPGYRLENHGLTAGGLGSLPSQGVSTQLMNVTVTDTMPARAAAAADAAARAFIQQVTGLQKSRFTGGAKAIQQQLNVAESNIQVVSQRLNDYKGSAGGSSNLRAQLNAYQSIYATLLTSAQEFSVGRDTALHAVKIFSPAPIPSSPTGPHPSRSALLYGFLALILCAGGLFLYDYLDDTARTPEEIEEVVGAPILGTIQQFDQNKYGAGLVSARKGHSPVSEAYRVIRTNIQFTDVDHPPRSLVVTSASPGEGKSTTASNLANVFAQAGTHVSLVDGDLRRPSLHTIFAVKREEGLTNMLIAAGALNGRGPGQTVSPNLDLIASGPLPPRPADLLGSARMKDITVHLSAGSALVIIDSPPVLAVTDAAVLSTVADGVILVVDAARSKRRDLRRAREAIEGVGGRILGIVVNRLDKRGSGYYYHYYQHHYGYPEKYDYPVAPERQLTDTKA